MTEPESSRTAPDRRDLYGNVAETCALVLAAASGFFAPTDWNITLGLLASGVALFLVGFFALAGPEA